MTPFDEGFVWGVVVVLLFVGMVVSFASPRPGLLGTRERIEPPDDSDDE